MGRHFRNEDKSTEDTQYTELQGNVYDENANGNMPPAPSEKYLNETDDGF